MLAVGLGIGVSVAHSPVASADSSTDWLSSIDSLLTGSALPAPSSGLDLAISFDGYSLVHDGSATAYTTSGEYGLAIAEGANSNASATGGTGDYALADGTNAYAVAGGESSDTGANYDTAIDIGNNPAGDLAIYDGAIAGNADLLGSANAGTGSYDTAIDIGNNSGGNDGPRAGAGGLAGLTGNGNGDNDTAIDFGNNSGSDDQPDAVDGNGNYASQSGTTTGDDNGAFAGVGNDNYASAVGGNESNADAGGSFYDTSITGNNDIAYVLDPFGTDGSDAFSGYDYDTMTDATGNNDLAAVLGVDDTTGPAWGANDLYDIVTALGNESGTAASTSGGFLAELLSLF
jgi:hypothetical protein